jgi:carboxypeptidase C (cathepsin A)
MCHQCSGNFMPYNGALMTFHKDPFPMRIVAVKIFALTILGSMLSLAPALAQSSVQSKDDPTQGKQTSSKPEGLKPEQQASKGSVTIAGTMTPYDAFAGTIIVHPKGWDDVPQNADRDDKNLEPESSMFYVAYFKSGDQSGQRPVTFFYNGGPGSSTVWLHMGAFGPKRVITLDDSHTPAAPYSIVNNEYSLLDATDLVFVDAPGTGFSRIAGKDREKTFYGVDADAEAFADFISQFLAKYGRWNSPKYLFGESYGTTRSAALINLLETERIIDFNGVILLSQVLNYDINADSPQFNPGIDLPYELALPTYTATAWYHHKLPDQPSELTPLLAEVEHFAMTDYAIALGAGSALSSDQRQAIVSKLHRYTGISAEYIEKSNLRVNAGQFEKTLDTDNDTTTGRLDTRFSGPTLDPLSKEAEYDPQSAAIGSAYVSAFNDYVRKDLKFGENREYKPEIDVEKSWNFLHQPPGVPMQLPQAVNVMVDLANAMKYNPDLKVMVNAGYFDLATPFFDGVYEMQHLPIPAKVQKNIEFKFYESGHMVYAHEASLKALHNNVAAFISATQNSKTK